MGFWIAQKTPARPCRETLAAAVADTATPFFVLGPASAPQIGIGGIARFGEEAAPDADALPILAYVPAAGPERLGDARFCRTHGLDYAYVAGEMANGIASEEMVEAMGQAGLLGFFGAAGLSLERVEQAIRRIQKNLGPKPYGFNLIHSPNEIDLENKLVALYLKYGVKLVCASAYLDLTLPLVRYRCAGIHRGERGDIVAPNRLVGKVSRVEVAKKFLSPPPAHLLQALVADGSLTAEQAGLAAQIPLAEDVTAEADSGGHTDNRPAITLVPTMVALRDQIQGQYRYPTPPRVGAAGGIATPASALAAFAMGAAYIVTGSINQSCVEAGISPAVKHMLAQSGQADVVMAPAADMFEMGVKVQVLKHGTMFAIRARKLYDLYREYPSLEAIPEALRANAERDLFKCSFAEAWSRTREYFSTRDPHQVSKAESDPKHKMALVFRSYLGQSSRWAIAGDTARKLDYQVWCGPAMGAFNEWARGSYLEAATARTVVLVAQNLLLGAAVLSRLATLRMQTPDLPLETYPLPRGPIAAETLARQFGHAPVTPAKTTDAPRFDGSEFAEGITV